MLDRFNNKPFASRYDPDSRNPYHAEIVNPCEICNEESAKFESEKVKFVWGKECDEHVREDFELKEEDVSYI